MKLYYHPVSTTCRPIMLLAAECGIALDYELVDLFTGAHRQPAFAEINPSHQVPVLEDEGFRLTESSAILKYIAEKEKASAYPSGARERARVNERLDWFNTGFYRDYCYGFIYPQIFATMKRSDDAIQAATIAYGREKALGWLKCLDASIIGPRNKFLCGDSTTLADYLGSIMALSIEAINGNLNAYPNISRWLGNMKALPSWARVNEAFYKYLVTPNRDKTFTGL